MIQGVWTVKMKTQIVYNFFRILFDGSEVDEIEFVQSKTKCVSSIMEFIKSFHKNRFLIIFFSV